MLYIFIILGIVTEFGFWHWMGLECGLIDFCSPWNGFLMISGGMGIGWFVRIGLVFEAKFEDVLLEIVHLVSTQNFLWEWHFVLPPDVVKLTVRVWEWEMLLLGGFCWRVKWMAPK